MVVCAECREATLRLYGKAVRQGCIGQLRALMLEEPLAYRMLLVDVQKKPAAHGGLHSSVPLCVAISEFREMIQPSGTAHHHVGGQDIIMLPDITMLVVEVMSVDVE